MSQDLSQLEIRLLAVLRDLKPYETIEIKRDGAKIVIVVKSTLRETFPVDKS